MHPWVTRGSVPPANSLTGSSAALTNAGCIRIFADKQSGKTTDRAELDACRNFLRTNGTLVIYKPDRITRSMKELLGVLEDQHARSLNLHILTGICAGLHKPNSVSIADKMLFIVAAMAAEMERDLIRERTLDDLAAAAQGRTGGRPPSIVFRHTRGRAGPPCPRRVGQHLRIGRSTLYRALEPYQAQALVPPPNSDRWTSVVRGR